MHFIFLYFFHPGGTSHGSPVRTDPLGQHYLILLLIVCLFVFLFFLHICKFVVTKPNKKKERKVDSLN